MFLAGLGRPTHEEDLREDSSACLIVHSSDALAGIDVSDFAKFLIELYDWFGAFVECL
jgi:hypothetical protein